MIINKFLKLFINDSSNNSNNNSNNNHKPIIPNYIIKKIISILCSYINSVNKSIESTDINFKNEKKVNKLIINLALVSKLFFEELSNNINSVINFKYDYLFNKISIQLINKKKCYSINENDITKYYKPNYPSNYIPATSKYSIIKLDNIKTIKLDYSRFNGSNNSSFYNSYILKDGSVFKLKYSKSLVLEKIKELTNLKRVVIRISSFDKSYVENIQLNNNLKNYKVQVSDYLHKDTENFENTKLIKKTGSLIIGSRTNDNILYDSIRHFKDSFKRLYINSTSIPLLEFIGQVDKNNQNLTIISDGINYFTNLTYIKINAPLGVNNIITILDSTPNLKELDLLICFNILILALSNEKNLNDLQLNNLFHCESCMFRDNTYRFRDDIKINYQHLIELFKNKSNLNTLRLSHKCRFTNSDGGIMGYDIINNVQDDSKLLSFHQQLSKLIQSIPNLSNLQLYGITNPLLFKHLIQIENNKSITQYRLNVGIGLPSINYIQLFQSLVNNNDHIQVFKYYEKGAQRDTNLFFKYNKTKLK